MFYEFLLKRQRSELAALVAKYGMQASDFRERVSPGAEFGLEHSETAHAVVCEANPQYWFANFPTDEEGAFSCAMRPGEETREVSRLSQLGEYSEHVRPMVACPEAGTRAA